MVNKNLRYRRWLGLGSVLVLLLGAVHGVYGMVTKRPLAAPIRLTSSLTGADLNRIHVGGQAGIMKIFAPNRRSVLFLKESVGSNVGGIDGEQWAPVSRTDRDSILSALGVFPAEVEEIDRNLVEHYARLPHLQAVALLGVLACPGNETLPLSPEATASTLYFLEQLVVSHEAGILRRQAVLALAIIPTFVPAETTAVLQFMKTDANDWDTFTTSQFFEYHRKVLLLLPNIENLKAAIAATNNPHAAGILKGLATDPIR